MLVERLKVLSTDISCMESYKSIKSSDVIVLVFSFSI